MGRVAVLIGLLLAAAVALQGQMPGPRSGPQDTGADSAASLAGVMALLGVSFVVMAFAMFTRRPPRPKAVPFEMRDFDGGTRGRMNRRLLLIALGLLLVWLAVFVAASQVRFEPELSQQSATPTATVAPDSKPQPTARPAKPKPHGDTYRVLAGATGVLLVMMVGSTVVAALRNRSKLPPVVLTGGPDDTGTPTAEPLAAAAEQGLAQVANLALGPREAIIACYAAMEQALAGAPGAAPMASDTPSEVLARAVGNRTISTGNATTLVELFAEARFSGHTMTEAHREQAERALRSVLAEVRAGA